MPAIGAEVADAYIEVHADTGPFRRELRREASLAAREASDEFGSKFTKAVDRDLDPLGASVSRKLREMGEIGGANLIEGIADEVRSRAERINKAFVQSITFGDFAPFIESFDKFDDAIEDFNIRLRDLNKEGVLTDKTFKRLGASFDAYVKTIQDDAIEQALAEQRKESIALLAAEEKRLARQTQINDLLSKDFKKNVDKLTASQEKLNDALDRPARDSDAFKGIAKDLLALQVSSEKATGALGKFNLGLGGLKGSRNDFLNFLGSLAGFLERNIGTGLEKVFQGVGNGVSSLGQRLSSVDGPLGSVGLKLDSFGNSINKLGAGGLDGLIIQVAAFILGLQGLVAILGPIAAGVSGLAAAVTALAVGIGGALLGGIVALGPALTALAAGVGAVAIAFTGLTKEQKALFTPLQDLFNEVRTAIQGELFNGLGDQVNGLTAALRPVGPFLTQIAGVFSDWVSEVVAEIGPSGPLAATFASLGNSLPGIFRTLLDLVSATGGALTGLFAGAAPGAQRLFEGITRVVEQFSQWANTAEGQRQINTFMQQAVDILGLLWQIAQQVGSALGALWGGGAQQSAMTLLTIIRNLVASFAEWLRDPANREQLLAFFRNGVQVAQSLGTVIGAMIRLFDSLDNTFTRLAFQLVIQGVTAVINKFTQFSTWTLNLLADLGKFVRQVNTVVQSIGNLGARAAAAGTSFRNSLGNAFKAVQTFLSNLSLRFAQAALAVANFVSRAITSIVRFAAQVGSGIQRALSFIGSLPGRASAAFAAFANAAGQGVARVIGAINNFISRAVSALGGLAGRFAGIGANIMQGLYNGVVGAAGKVLSYIRGLASDVAATFASVLGIASPSKLFRSFGGDIVNGLIQGMNNSRRAAIKESDDLALSVINAAQTTLSRARNSIREAANSVSSILTGSGSAPRLVKAFKQLGEQSIRALTNGLSIGREAASKEISTIVERIGEIARNAMKKQDKKTRTSIANQSKALQTWVKEQGKALDLIWREVDRAGVRLDAARERLQELQEDFTQMREQVRDSLAGELDLGGSIGDDGTATFESVSAQVSGLAQRMKTFAGLIKKLIKAGFPAALVQEVAALGTTEGITVANALLSGTKQQQQGLINDFESIQGSADTIGKLLATQMYQAGIDAQKGLIKGLEANQKALTEAAKKLAKKIADAVRKELGIKSPSRVFMEIGRFITEGLAQGIEAGQPRVDSAVNGLVPTDLNNINPPISALGAQAGVTGGGAGVGGIEAGAITIVSPFANPRLVAIEALDALAARGK